MCKLDSISTKELEEELNKRRANNSKRKRRYEITGVWSGNTSSQRRLCYRDYTDSKDYAEKVTNLGFIVFDDRTSLDLKVRELEYRERKQPKIGAYTSLIRSCIVKDVNSVKELHEDE